MVRHVVVDRGVDGAGAQPVGDGEQEQHPVALADREAQETQHRQGDGDDHDPLGMEAADHSRAEQGGEDGHEGDGHRHIARPGGGDAEDRLHGGPAGAQQGIRQTETDENEIDDSQKERSHLHCSPIPNGFCS